MIVLDASCIMKWLFEEEGTDLSLSFKDNHITGKERVAVPELLFYEVANVLATKTALSQIEGEDALSLLFEFELETYSLGLTEFLLSFSLSYQYKITIYDAVYIALSQVLGCKFITADKRLFEKIKGLKNVKLLGGE